MSEKRSGLGKGLSALIPEAEGADTTFRHVHADEVRPNPRQPRRTFSEESLEELAASIAEVGLLQPIVVFEAGWATIANEFGERASEANQMRYYNEMLNWATKSSVSRAK